MPITISGLLADQRLGLRLLSGRDHIKREVLWAHTSEFTDPSPWLDGGELLMTMGLNCPADVAAQEAYVERLAHAGVAGLAFDTGTILQRVPSGVVTAGERLGIPVLQIPPATPFIAISRAVVAALTQDQIRAFSDVAKAQDRVAAAAVSAGPRGVAEALAACLRCQVALFGPRGTVMACAGHADPLVGRVRLLLGGSDGGRRPVHFTHVDDHGVITVQSISGRSASLVLGSDVALTHHERLIVGHAAAVLSLLLRRPHHVAELEEQLRRAVARAVLLQGAEPDPGLMRVLGFGASSRVVVAVADGVARVDEVAKAIDAELGAEGRARLIAATLSGVAIVMPAADAQELLIRVQGILTSHEGERPALGYSEPHSLQALAAALAQAKTAARSGRGAGNFRGYGDLSALDLLLRAQPVESLQALVASTLGPLVGESSQRQLLDALEAFLAHNGQWQAAAASIGVHRHTLRQRLGSVATILGRDLADSVDRGELWVALVARRHLVTSSQSADAPRTTPRE